MAAQTGFRDVTAAHPPAAASAGREMSEVADLLNVLALEMPCPLCGRDCRLPLKTLETSRGSLHPGCPLEDEHAGARVFYGPLLDPSLLGDLRSIWERLLQQARGAGGRVVISPGEGVTPPARR